ncbi:MAG: hypothetical protein JOZ15_12310 [Acidobacteria bacterium]|nr:hypothetical protein [Acidobacteriota bacterium]
MPPPKRQPDALERWLAAERSGLDDAAEGALAELLVELPQPAPPPGFAERVLARALPSLPHLLVGRPGWPARGRRAALGLAAAAVVALSLSPLWLRTLAPGVPAALAARATPAITAVLRAANVSRLLQAGLHAAVAAGQGLADLAAIASQLLLLVRAVAEPLATPPVAVLAGACLAVSVLAMRLLYELIQRDRRWVRAEPI